MIRDLILSHISSFTKEEKEKCLPVVKQIFQFANIYYCEGLLALETEAREGNYNFFIKTAIQFIVDGTDPSYLELVFQNLILSESYTGTELLERLLSAQGLLFLQYGMSPYVINKYITSLLGEAVIQQVNDEEEKDINYEKYFLLLRSYKNKTTLPKCVQFSYLLLYPDDRTVMRILLEVSISNVIGALRGCGKDVIDRVLHLVSFRKAIYILERLHVENEELEDIINEQKEILHKIKELENSGEICLLESIKTFLL